MTAARDNYSGLPGADLRSYGRRRGRSLSDRQRELWRHVLPRVGLPRDVADLRDPRALFAPAVEDVWLEIGFGGGEHLLWQANAHPHIGLIGCEPFEDGVVKVLGAIDADAIANIRVLVDDARPYLRRLPDACIGRAFILFPDPWPKKRHHKRRLVSELTLQELARIVRPGGDLRMATDIGDYARWMLLAIRAQGQFQWTAQQPSDWRARPADWPETRYEQKARREGRRCAYFRLLRV